MDAVRKSRRHSCPTNKSSSLARLVSQTKLVRVVVGAYTNHKSVGTENIPKTLAFRTYRRSLFQEMIPNGLVEVMNCITRRLSNSNS